MYKVDERGIISFRDPFRFIFGLLYHWSSDLYVIGPEDNGFDGKVLRKATLKGQGFLLHGGSPFVRLGLGHHHIIRLASDAETSVRACHLNYNNGRLSPLLDTSNNFAVADLLRDEVTTIVLGNVSSMCLFSTNQCELSVEIESVPHQMSKFVGRVCVATNKSKRKRLIYTSVEVRGTKSGTIDVVSPEFAPVAELIHQTLDIMSLPPPMLPLIALASPSITCCMIYQDGYLWSDFKGFSSSWALDISTASIKSVTVSAEYTSNGSKLGGTLILRHKVGPNTFKDVSANTNHVAFADVAEMTLTGITLSQPYDNISVVVRLGDTADFNILPSSKCKVIL